MRRDFWLAPPTPEIEQERRVAIYDLLEENRFALPRRDDRAAPAGPYRLTLAIRDRRLAPGARILETDVARRFNVSRQPVREAIRMLEHEGLLTSVPNRGTFVTRVTVEDSIAICDVREELEGLAARLAVRHLTAEDRRAILEILRDTKSNLPPDWALESGDTPGSN